MIEVELDVFSGTPNPRWVLTALEGEELTQRLLDGSETPIPIGFEEPRLGYRGFIVRSTGVHADVLEKSGRPTTFRLRQAMVGAAADAERSLLQTNLDSALSPTESRLVSEAVMSELDLSTGEQSSAVAAAAASVCSLLYTSWNDFSFWNGTRRNDNNCYNYASNYASNTFAQPGLKGGSVFSALTVASIKAAMRRDGWIDDCNTSNLKVALVIWPGLDFHFYRKNLNSAGTARWCHKPGHTPARNTDNSGAYITSPQTCDRGGYTTWGGVMYSDGVRSRVVR